MREQFKTFNFRADTLEVIDQANSIIEEYLADGYSLTLRQLYYQFVARGLIPNQQKSYDRLGAIVNNGRLAGLIDWMAIEDRTRNLAGNTHWDDPASIIRAAAHGYRLDLWEDQEYRVEVWVEKEALSGVVERVAVDLDIDYFSCRGYVSQSEQWRAGKRFAGYGEQDQKVIVLHLGDHDPSGVQMTEDNDNRLWMFSEGNVQVLRIALNMDQVRELNPPPNPAKLTDSRAGAYIRRYGRQSWELDALEPKYIDKLIRENVALYRDDDLFEARRRQQEQERSQLYDMAANFKDE